MKWNSGLTMLTVFTATLMSLVNPNDTPTLSLKGNWVIKEMVENGEKVKLDALTRDLRSLVVHIGEEDISYVKPQLEERVKITYSVIAKEKPMAIDLKSPDNHIKKGIFALEKNRLVLCVNTKGDGERPKAFQSLPGSDYLLLTLETAPKAPGK